MSKIEKVLATGKTHTTLSNAGTTSRGHNGNAGAGPRRRDRTGTYRRLHLPVLQSYTRQYRRCPERYYRLTHRIRC